MVAPHPPVPPQTLRSSQWTDVGLWILRRRQRFQVTGDSMRPLLRPGEEVLIDPMAYRQHPPQIGDLVIAEHPQRPGFRLIKWVMAVESQSCFLQGINLAASTDSRSFGWVSLEDILGRVICRFP